MARRLRRATEFTDLDLNIPQAHHLPAPRESEPRPDRHREHPPMRLFLALGIALGVMTITFVIYGSTLSDREDDQLFLNKAEQTMMASEQHKLIGQMRWLTRLIYPFVDITVLLLLASAGLWVWIGLQ